MAASVHKVGVGKVVKNVRICSEVQWTGESDVSEVNSRIFLCPLRAHMKTTSKKKHWQGMSMVGIGNQHREISAKQKQTNQTLPAPYHFTASDTTKRTVSLPCL